MAPNEPSHDPSSIPSWADEESEYALYEAFVAISTTQLPPWLRELGPPAPPPSPVPEYDTISPAHIAALERQQAQLQQEVHPPPPLSSATPASPRPSPLTLELELENVRLPSPTAPPPPPPPTPRSPLEILLEPLSPLERHEYLSGKLPSIIYGHIPHRQIEFAGRKREPRPKVMNRRGFIIPKALAGGKGSGLKREVRGEDVETGKDEWSDSDEESEDGTDKNEEAPEEEIASDRDEDENENEVRNDDNDVEEGGMPRNAGGKSDEDSMDIDGLVGRAEISEGHGDVVIGVDEGGNEEDNNMEYEPQENDGVSEDTMDVDSRVGESYDS